MNKPKNIRVLADLYRCFVVITGFLVAFYMFIATDINSPYKFYFLIPFIFSVTILIYKKISKNISYIGMMTLLAIMYFKYIVMPFVNCLSDYTLWRGVSPNESFLKAGVWLTIYEMLGVLIIINIFEGKFYNNTDKKSITVPKRYGIYVFVVVLALLLVIIFPGIPGGFISSVLASDQVNKVIPAKGLWITIFNFGSLILLLLLISYYKVKYDKSNSFKYVIVSIITILIYLFVSAGYSRWSIAIPGLILMDMMTKLFKKYKMIILLCIGTVLLVGLIAITSMKMNYNYDNINSNSTLWADTLQMYFSGPKNIAFAIETKQFINVTYGYFPLNVIFNDFFRSVAGLSRFTNSYASTVDIFNTCIYKSTIAQDQIVPMMGQSFTYFGYLFSPLLTIFATIIMMFFEGKANKGADLMKYYIFSFTAVWFARAMMLNATIIFSQLTNTLCLFLIIKWTNDRIAFIRNKRKIYKINEQRNSHNIVDLKV